MRATIINWDGTNLPEELHRLPPGHYVLSQVADTDDDEMTEEEEAAVMEGLNAFEAGNVLPYEEAMRELRARTLSR